MISYFRHSIKNLRISNSSIILKKYFGYYNINQLKLFKDNQAFRNNFPINKSHHFNYTSKVKGDFIQTESSHGNLINIFLFI